MIVGGFVALFAYTNKQMTHMRTHLSIGVQAVCSLHLGKKISIQCHPDLTKADCTHLPKQKCPLKRMKKLKNMSVSTKQTDLAKSLLTTPQNSFITIIVPPRGRAIIKKIHINNQTLFAH